MEKFPIFVINHPYLFSLLFVILTLLIWNIFGGMVGGVKLLTADEATQLINREDAELIDIRSQKEFENGHIINAKNFSLHELPEKLNKYRKNNSKGIGCSPTPGRLHSDMFVYCLFHIGVGAL